jgi:anti-anti-sigma factor
MDFTKINDCGPDSSGIIYSLSGEIVTGQRSEKLLLDINEELDSGKAKIVIDLGGIFYINSSGVGFLIQILKRIHAKGAQIAIVNLQREVAQVFYNANLFKIFPYYKTTEEAFNA